MLLTNPKFITVQLDNTFQSSALVIDHKILSFFSCSSCHFASSYKTCGGLKHPSNEISWKIYIIFFSVWCFAKIWKQIDTGRFANHSHWSHIPEDTGSSSSLPVPRAASASRHFFLLFISCQRNKAESLQSTTAQILLHKEVLEGKQNLGKVTCP